jgi:hypothetical protein
MAIDVIRSKIVIADLSYIKPVFRANYLQIKVIAEVTMPDVLNVDIVTPVDLVTLSTTKSLSDITDGFLDQIVRTLGKSFADSATSTDLLTRTAQKNLAEIQALADADQISFFKALADFTSPEDLAALSTVKALADTISTPTDSVANAIHKVFADSVTLVDFARPLNYTYVRLMRRLQPLIYIQIFLSQELPQMGRLLRIKVLELQAKSLQKD